jgi:S1-C subfamily serine protease
MGLTRVHGTCSVLRFFCAATLGAAMLPVSAGTRPALAATADENSSTPPASSIIGRSHVASADDETLQLTNLQCQFQRVADSVAPSVVAISAAVAPLDSDDAVRSDDLSAPKLDAMLDRVTRTVGTGFVIERDGFILTNEHVIGDAQQIWVTSDDHKVYPAIVVGSDPRADLAVLKIPAANLRPARFAPVGSIKRGEWTIALGNPYGLAGLGEMAMSVGVVSATDRSLPKLATRENRLYTNLIQTTAQINPGNSGGPLFNLAGEVIGINTAVVMPQKQTNGIGFAMPISDDIIAKVRDLKEGREIVYGYIGVMVNNPTPRQRREAGAPAEAGVIVDSVEPNSPAETATLKIGDVIVSIAGGAVRDSEQFVRLIGGATVDLQTEVSVMRGGKPVVLTVTPKRRPMPSVAVTKELQRFRWRGLVLGPIPTNWTGNGSVAIKDRIGLMVFGVDSTSPMAKDGLTSGSVITTIAGKPVADLLTLQRIINDTPAEQCKVTFAQAGDGVASAK